MLAAIGVTAPIASDYTKCLKQTNLIHAQSHKLNKEQIQQKEAKIESKARTT